MSSPSPSPSTSITQITHFLFDTWLGQGLILFAIPAVLGFIFRTWIKTHLLDLWRLLLDVRVTRQRTIDTKIREAEAAVRAEQAAQERAKSQAIPDPWLPRKLSEEEATAARDERRRKGELKDQWVISTDRSVERGYFLENVAARVARNVRLTHAYDDVFEVISGPPWDRLANGEIVSFQGRIADPARFKMSDRRLIVRWTDDHGDEQQKRLQLDNDYSETSLF